MKQLKVLVLDSLRNLRDISALKECKELRKLRIEYCGKADLWNLPESDSLRYLSIQGSKRISSLNDLKSLPKLEEMMLDGCYVEDGNMECLKRIQHAVLFENRRHYSAKDADLPKRKMPYLLEDIPRWRQFFP